LNILNGLNSSEFRAKELISKLENSVYTTDLGSKITDRNPLTIYNLLLTVFQKTGNLNTDHVEIVENLVLSNWEKLQLPLQAMIMDLYQKTGNKSETLAKKFEILTHTIDGMRQQYQTEH